MRIGRIQVHNFRNFADLDIRLAGHSVIVGENKIGKSNLVFALRLLLDPSLPDSARYLHVEDFWDGLPRPLGRDDRIEVSVDLVEFEDREDHLALLADYLVEAEPLTARLTYRFQPRPDLGRDPTAESDYEFVIFGGTRPEQSVPPWVRRRLPLVVLEALRDAEGDLERWRRSPLRPLLESATGRVEASELEAIAEAVQDATEAVAEHAEMKTLADLINTRIDSMVGSHNSVLVALGFTPTTAERLVRALRLFIDRGLRSVGDASLGTANLIYLALKTLELQQLAQEKRHNYVILAIEEPEAHLHPHLQRLVYRDFLRTRTTGESGGTSADGQQRFVLLTTHSPHIVSVAPVRSLVLLKHAPARTSTIGVSTAQLELSESEAADLERYLDVTRGEIMFANGVLLVEGVAEEFLVPQFGALLGYPFDEWGITVCAVGGVNFAPYVRLLGPSGLDIPHAVLTDLDPVSDGTSLGAARVRRLLDVNRPDADPNSSIDDNELKEDAASHGIFLNSSTIEIELLKAGATEELCDTLLELAESSAAQARASSWKQEPSAIREEELLKDIQRIGKGRFAQRLVQRLRAEHCPEYIHQAIKHVVQRLQ
jgi:putative ATP-dependent endonuclease of OLD family